MMLQTTLIQIRQALENRCQETVTARVEGKARRVITKKKCVSKTSTAISQSAPHTGSEESWTEATLQEGVGGGERL